MGRILRWRLLQLCQNLVNGLYLPFGIVMTKLFHMVERKMYYVRQTFEKIVICEFDEKFDIWFNEDTIAQTFSSYIQFDCEGYALSDTFYRIEIEPLLLFKLCPVLFR